LIFKRIDGHEVCRIVSYDKPKTAEELLAAGEQIIGVYGHYDGSYIAGMGFLVWKPDHPN
jgi:hypothetical protein